MNGAHDMGGMHGFGPIASEAGEPPFHAEWERRMLGLVLAMGATGLSPAPVEQPRQPPVAPPGMQKPSPPPVAAAQLKPSGHWLLAPGMHGSAQLLPSLLETQKPEPHSVAPLHVSPMSQTPAGPRQVVPEGRRVQRLVQQEPGRPLSAPVSHCSLPSITPLPQVVLTLKFQVLS